MEKKNNVWGGIVAFAAVIAALVAVLVLFVRTEQRLYRLIGFVESYLPRRQKNAPFEVEL